MKVYRRNKACSRNTDEEESMSTKKSHLYRACPRRFLIAVFAVVMPSFLAFVSALAATDSLIEVSPNEVCMTNDAYMGRPQIAVPIDNKTYYGCCYGCVAALKEDINTRYAVDPVSGTRVDKAIAVIGALRDGKVLYFRNEENFMVYRAKVK